MNEQVLPPNFDDERTLRSARKVVPLNEIDAKVRRLRYWFLGGAFAIAMMLGAASALVASYVRLRNAPVAVTNEMPPAPAADTAAPAPVAVVENPMPNESPVTEETEPPVETALETPTKEPVAKRHTAAKHTQEAVDLPDDLKMTEDERLQQIRDAVLYDEWQERRARRVLRRERRLDRYNHRDLSNLDEIFEGRKRP
jgi:hypothetical protein